MTTLTEVVAAVVVQSSAVAFSHFGVTPVPAVAPEHVQPVAERVVARTPRKLLPAADCPEGARVRTQKV